MPLTIPPSLHFVYAYSFEESSCLENQVLAFRKEPRQEKTMKESRTYSRITQDFEIGGHISMKVSSISTLLRLVRTGNSGKLGVAN